MDGPPDVFLVVRVDCDRLAHAGREQYGIGSTSGRLSAVTRRTGTLTLDRPPIPKNRGNARPTCRQRLDDLAKWLAQRYPRVNARPDDGASPLGVRMAPTTP